MVFIFLIAHEEEETFLYFLMTAGEWEPFPAYSAEEMELFYTSS